ncbi:integrase, catalytic region, zinc finger, CCHC-type containing protein [Tanacetum coccineum]
MSMSVQKSQVHKMAKFIKMEMRLCLVDDLKVLKIALLQTSQDKGTSSSLKSKITTTIHKLKIEVKDYELRTKDKASKYFEIEKKELLIENDRLLEQILSQDIVCIAMHSYDDLVDKYASMEKSYVEAYNQCLELEAELVVQIVLWYLDSGCFKHMTGHQSQHINFVSKFMGTIRFGNDQVVAIMGYGDYQFRNVTISRVYYVEGLGHNLFPVGQFCDSKLEVAFQKHSCFVCDLDGVDLLKGSQGSNLYTISLEDMLKSSPICLLSKASKTKSWLWHRRLSHLNFGTINQLLKSVSLEPPPSVVSPMLPVVFLIPADTTDTPSSTTVDPDAPSASTSLTTEETQAPVIHQCVEEQTQEYQNAQFDNDPFFNIFNPDPSSEESLSRDVIPSNLH